MAWPPPPASRRVALVVFGVALLLHIGVSGLLQVSGLSARAAVIGSELVALLGVSLWMARLMRLPLREAFALRPAAPVHWAMALGAALPLQLAGGSLQFAIIGLLPDESLLRQSMERTIGELVRIEGPADLLMLLGAAVAAAAVCEEFLFRGLILQLWRRRSGWSAAILATAVLFALFHLNPIVLFPVGIVGAYLGILVWRSGSLYPAIAAHAANNFLGLFGLPLVMEPTTYAHWVGVIFLVAAPSFALLLILYLRHTRPPP